MTGKFPMAPKMSIPTVDVRDVAFAHVAAIEKGKDGNRYILSEYEGQSFLTLASTLKREFSGSSYQLPTREAPRWVVWLMSILDRRLEQSLPTYGHSFCFDNTRSKDELGVKYRDLSQSIVEMANNLIDINYIKDLKN